MNYWTLFFVFLLLVTLDKGLTYINVSAVQKTNPENYLTIEKNPAARFFFQKFGLLGGTLAFGIVTLISLYVVYYFFSKVFNPEQTLWGICLVYALVIGNNAFFALKFNGLLK